MLPESSVCAVHGGAAPRVARKAQARRELSSFARTELARRDGVPPLDEIEHRDVWVIMRDAVSLLDSVMRSGELTGATAIEHAERVIKMGKMITDSGVADRMVRAQERAAGVDADLVFGILRTTVEHVAAGLGLDPWQAEHLRQSFWSTARAVLTDAPLPVVEPLGAAGPPALPPSVPVDVDTAEVEWHDVTMGRWTG